MPDFRQWCEILSWRRLVITAIVVTSLAASGCVFSVKRQVAVPQLLTPLVEADMVRLIAEVNRVATVRSLRGKVDIQFLDTSFAECGIAEKYRTADGTFTLQRPGQVYLVIQAPFVGTSIAEMTSDGDRFRVAVLQGEERFRRFVRGTNSAIYPKLETNGGQGGKCGDGGGKKNAMNVQRAVGALSGLRPQHFTDALLVRPIAQADPSLLYARSEAFVEEPDSRAGAKNNARAVRGYYILDELVPEGEGRARPVRRFWFDRYGNLRLSRLQTFDQSGQLTTDIVYKEPKNFGEGGRYVLPSLVELTRPQDHYSLRISYQSPEAVKVDQEYNKSIFLLENKWQLPEVDLDARGGSGAVTIQQ